MLGWDIYIYRNDLVADPRAIAPPGEALLAHWEGSIGGTKWIESLVKEGRGRDLSRSEYPCIYIAKAADVIPLISAGPPIHSGPIVLGDNYVHLSGWIGNATYHPDRVAACSPDVDLLIHAWDQS